MPIRPRDRQTRSSPLVFRNCSIPLGRFAGTAVELLYNAINNKMNRRIGDRLTTATRDHLRQGYEAIMSCRAPAQGSGFYIVEISRNGRDFITTGFVFQYGGFTNLRRQESSSRSRHHFRSVGDWFRFHWPAHLSRCKSSLWWGLKIAI